MKQKKLRVGVIGLGVGRGHARRFAGCQCAELVALCDSDKTKLAEAVKDYPVEHAFSNYKRVLELPNLDAVSIATPNYLHAPIALAALRAGKHVLCEKPMATNSREAEAMVRAAKRARKVLMVHYNFRFARTALELKKRVEAGELGDIYYAKAAWLRRWGLPGSPWFSNKAQAGGGALIDIGVHVLDLALWFMGFPKPVSAAGSTYAKFGPADARASGKKFDVDDLGVGLVKLQNGATLLLEASWAGHTLEGEAVQVELCGTKGGAQLTLNELTLIHHKNAKLVDTRLRLWGSAGDPCCHFACSIVKRQKPMGTGEEGLVGMRVLDAIYQSAAESCRTR